VPRDPPAERTTEEKSVSEKKRKPKATPSAGATAGRNSSQGAGPMNVDFLQKLVDLMSANDLNTVDLRDSGQRIILKRGAQQVFTTAAAPAPAQYAASPAPAPAATSGGASTPGAAAPDEDANLVPLRSPMVGTFYSKPSPDAKAFVSVGSVVVKDETDVCIIEAMKTFNTLKSDVSGTIVRILIQDGQTVDVNKPLFLVKPA
jgi:acetyl-CoA carboxylase biotin carboxyl carrier protein